MAARGSRGGRGDRDEPRLPSDRPLVSMCIPTDSSQLARDPLYGDLVRFGRPSEMATDSRRMRVQGQHRALH